MASGSEDSEGEDLSMIRPTLINELRNVLDMYPDDGQILKELIQNAEDAGATEVKVLTDKRTFHQDLDPGILKRHPHLRFFQGPALCVYNDAEFTPDDWKGIRMLHASIKQEDPLKVGRFGLGFKSVFHLTDRLVILSGGHIMYMDPFKGEDHYCKRHRVGSRKQMELDSIMQSLEGVFGINRDLFQAGESGHFPGTLFWFPLRQNPSALSSTVYRQQSMDQLIASFKAEASSLLLFLNHVLSVTILGREEGQHPQELFSVGVAADCLEEVQKQKRQFVAGIRSVREDSGLPDSEVICLTQVLMETRDLKTASSQSQRWLVGSYHCGGRDVSSQLQQLCSDQQLSYRPYVGVAVPLSSSGSGERGFQSQIFCFLPLPLDTRSPTGLPVHVHGYFALEQNRRHLKWPAADQLWNQAALDKPSLWNTLLVTELLPKIYCMAICRLKELTSDNPETFYCAWPDRGSVQDRWLPLVQPLYAALEKEAVFYTQLKGWVALKQAVLQRFNPRFTEDVEKAVVRVYTINRQNLVELPEHVYESMEAQDLLRVEKIKAARVSLLISQALQHLDRAEKLCLLHYLHQSDPRLLLNQPLLPLADRSGFTMFKASSGKMKNKKKGGQVSIIHWCPEDLVLLFPGLEAEFCDFSLPDHITADLQNFAKTGLSNLDKLHKQDPRIPALLKKSLQARFGSKQAMVDIDDAWLQRVWRHLFNLHDLSAYSDVPLLPLKVDPVDATDEGPWRLCPLAGVYVCRQASDFAHLSTTLGSAVSHLGVTVLDSLPDVITRHRAVLGHFVNHPSDQGLLKAIRQIDADATLRRNATSTFNSKATEQEKVALIHFIANLKDTESKLPSLFQELELFTSVLSKKPASICQVPYLGPEEQDLPTVSVPRAFLQSEPSARKAALKLGAKVMTLLELAAIIMSSFTPQSSQDDVARFMMYFLKSKKLMGDLLLLNLAKRIPFVRTDSNELKLAGDLYDPTSPLLRELFQTQHSTLFPSAQFGQEATLKKLRKLGLRTEKYVKPEDIVHTAKIISKMFSTHQQDTAKQMAQALFTYLKTYGQTVDEDALQILSTIQCMPCIQTTERPKDYPRSLPLQSSSALAKSAEMSHYKLIYTTGSVVPILTPGLPENVVDHLQVMKEARPEDVLQHLENVVDHFQQEEVSQNTTVLKEIFQFFAACRFQSWAVENLRYKECVLVETGDKFARPDKFWIQRKQNDIDLKPYRFALSAELARPPEMQTVRKLLEACGSSLCQNETMLNGVLTDIELEHSCCVSPHPRYHSDLQLVRQILEVLKQTAAASSGKNTLLPVVNPDHKNVLKFMAAKECTIHPTCSSSINLQDDDEAEIYFVHPDISASTALALGALALPERALTDVEDLDYTYGQRENLTDRLSKLLKEAYTDGFSVPKELVQNADDAGASKVCFLLDERDNSAFTTNLIDENMASLQGPAIWAFNNAEFSDADFENIVTLGREKKKGDVAKVGRFGLGFNAVYNLTEVPAFISGNRLAMFDPQMKYIRKGKGGLLLDFTKPGNKALLGRMPEQFGPFQGIFGCTLKRNEDCYYQGTLFRFPLRTAAQAENSRLKADKRNKDSYSETKRREFLRMLLEKAGTLLMFTQCVKEIEVYYLPSHLSDPENKKCILTVKKKSSQAIVHPPLMQIGGRTILQLMKEHWSRKNKDIRMTEKLTIQVTITDEAKSICGMEESHSVTDWHLAWASGVGRCAGMVQVDRQEGLVPLATVAVSVKHGQLLPLKDSPTGFYTKGHLFCFLPLPEEMVHLSLPVHINGTFALTSDRRGLLRRTEDDLEEGQSSWNLALFDDAVVRAYLLLLEQVKKEAAVDPSHQKYFNLWPTASMGFSVVSFYRQLQSEQYTVFPVASQQTWVDFAQARFLHLDFRKSPGGKIAWDCLQKFWKGPGYLVDVPYPIYSLLKENGPPGSFDCKVITELAFYREYFLPNLRDSWWQLGHRDFLLHQALLKNDQQLNQLIKDNSCIPCQASSQLRKPSEVIHPYMAVAKLFLASEGFFPQTTAKDRQGRPAQDSSKVDFCEQLTLSRLCGLGMITDELPFDRVVERAESVSQLYADKSTEEQALGRAYHLIDYMSNSSNIFRSQTLLEKYPSTVLQSLSCTAFLPVLPKPADWPFPWAGIMPASCPLLAPPNKLFCDSLKNLASCSVPLLDTKALKGQARSLTTKMKDVLKALGLTLDVDCSQERLQECAVRQLTCIVEHSKTNASLRREHVQGAICDIYNFLKRCLDYSRENKVQNLLHSQLFDKEVVWTGADFVRASCVAFTCHFDCSPHLFHLEKSLQTYKLFFQSIGVKERFEAGDVLAVLHKLHQEHASKELAQDVISLVSRLAQLLVDIVKTALEPQSLDTAPVYLPDRRGILRIASDLCLDDCEWLKESERMTFVHDMIAPEVARRLGVKSKRTQDFDNLTKPIPWEKFGQHEELTSRIARLLEGYTFDSSLWKELIQNADDAGATEAKLIMDFRNLDKTMVPEKWEVLQGPALSFYNNRSFTTEDVKGIQNLGVGSKGQDALKIGQFGVGFNAVFHLTDVPSFWTKQDDIEDVICVFDPNCRYVPKASPDSPGIKFTEMARTAQQYPHFMSGYLSTAIDMSQPGTLFRFPLRTKDMAAESKIKKKAVTQQDIRVLLKLFESEMATCLLFLNSIQKIGIYSVKEDGSLELQFGVSKAIEGTSIQQADHFRTRLQQAAEKLKRSQQRVEDIEVCEAVVQFSISNSSGQREDWLTVHRLGFTPPSRLTPGLTDWSRTQFRLLPRGGVAVRLAETGNQTAEERKPIEYQAFCTLPLPVFTSLPVHVNGHFALDHETRRNLWDSGSQTDDDQSQWNEAIVSGIVVPAYLTALHHVKMTLFPAKGRDLESAVKNSRLRQYHTLFPCTLPASAGVWSTLTRDLYQAVASQQLPLFPSRCPEGPELEWMPVMLNDGFAGYFTNLTKQFMDQAQEKESSENVVLTHGRSAATNHNKTDESKVKADVKTLEEVLKRCNMKILEAPFRLYEEFRFSGVQGMQEVTPASVLTFLASSRKTVPGNCCINNLPNKVENTPLKTAQKVHKLVKFLSRDKGFLQKLEGLPLSFRQSGTLYWFSSSDSRPKPIVSKFSHLLPGSADDFLHDKIRQFFHETEHTEPVLQQLDIPKLASRLPQTLKDPRLWSGKPCHWDKTMFPSLPGSKSWIDELWEFLETSLRQKDKRGSQKEVTSAQGAAGRKEDINTKQQAKTEGKELRHKAAEALQILHQWCLLPVKKMEEKWPGSLENQGVLMLYPLQNLHRVVYLPAIRDQSNGALWTVLRQLPLPVLYKLNASSIASQLVASISHPTALLHALASCAQCLAGSHTTSSIILNYFDNNLDILEDASANKEKLKNDLRSLPVFPSIEEGLIPVQSVHVICLQASFPHAGLSQWSRQRHSPLILLLADDVPPSLIQYLGFEKLTDAQFYARYLLPSIDSLPHHKIITHLDFLREKFFRGVYSEDNMDENQKQLSGQLKDTAFIEVDGKLRKARDFYSPVKQVFVVMCPEKLPPDPYKDMKWDGLLTASGMVCDITDDMFLSFARSLEKEQNDAITDELVAKSQTLVSYLFSRPNIECGILSDVRSIRFLLPSDWVSTEKGRQLQMIAPAFCNRRLVSYAESLLEDQLHIVWSSSCLLHPSCDPQCYLHHRNVEKTVMSQLGLQDKAPKDKVIQHVRNLCSRLGGEEGSRIFSSLPEKKHLITVMEKLYQYLGDLKDHDLSVLKDLKVIYDIDKSQMFHPKNIVLDLRQNEMIKDHIQKAPFQFGSYFDLFIRLGAARNVTANHYASVLSWLKGLALNDPLNVEEGKMVKTAVEGLFRCLREGDHQQKILSERALYLPTEEHCLHQSTSLVFKDNYFGDRFQRPPEGMHFFLGFEKLGIKITVPDTEIKLLPNEHRVKLMSELAHEIVPNEILLAAEDADCSNQVVSILRHHGLVQGMVRLAFQEHNRKSKPFTEKDAEEISNTVTRVSVKEVAKLKTVITMSNTVVTGTEKSKASFTVFNSGEPKTAVVYMAAKATRNWLKHKEECVHSLALSLMHVLWIHIDSYLLHCVLRDPQHADKILDNGRVPMYRFARELDESLIPEAGAYVPLIFHHHLNNSFLEFYVGEHVGYEVYDHETDDDARNVEENLEPVFIYGIILREEPPSNAAESSHLTRRYLVDLGPDQEKKEVSALRLYKLVRPAQEHSDTSIAIRDQQHDQTQSDREASRPPEMNVVLSDIRRLLTEAWQLPDHKDRKRVVKRLLLQWHPDKNRVNEEFCTRVTQTIQQYVALLEQGRPLPAEDSQAHGQQNTFREDFSAGSDFFSFFSNMHARGARHRQYFEEEASRYSQGQSQSGSRRRTRRTHVPNPQPGESSRWFRQAQADVIVAKESLETCARGRNWICYQCHQAVEKALKAVLFKRDVNSDQMDSHDLPSLAKAVAKRDRHSSLQDLVQGLESRLGPRSRMCYPDVMAYPRIPDEVYTRDDAVFACDTASRILEECTSLLRRA